MQVNILSLCVAIPAVQNSPIDTHQMHGGTGRISAAELCLPAGFTRGCTVHTSHRPWETVISLKVRTLPGTV